MRVSVGYDHAGFPLAQLLAQSLRRRDHAVVHFGPESADQPVDYVPYCVAAAESVAEGHSDFGIVIGGSGQGEQIAANKVNGIRAALCTSPYFAHLARRDNDANVLALPGRIVAAEFALEIVDMWLLTSFEGGRHARRIGHISAYESRQLDISHVRSRMEQ